MAGVIFGAEKRTALGCFVCLLMVKLQKVQVVYPASCSIGFFVAFASESIFPDTWEKNTFCTLHKGIRRNSNYRLFCNELINWKTCRKIKALLYILLFTKVLWFISGSLHFLCWNFFFLLFSSGWSANGHQTKTTCVTLSESKAIEKKPNESSGGLWKFCRRKCSTAHGSRLFAREVEAEA